jgi:hypothetical protein
MATSCMIIGESGTGKSTAISYLNPDETFIINIANKPLPFKGWKSKYTKFDPKEKVGNIYETSDANIIVRLLQLISNSMPHIKTIVIDDLQYLSSFEYMHRAEETGFAKFNSIGKNLFSVVTEPKELRDDLVIFYLTHVEVDTDINGIKRQKAKTIGKMIDSVITLEGLFTIVLFGKVKKTKEGVKYIFETVNSGDNTCKAPQGMFDKEEIDNNLQNVRESILNYQN